MLGEERHDVVLGLGQLDLLLVHKHLAAVIIDAHSLCAELPRRGIAAAQGTVTVQAQGSTHAGQQLAGAEGLGDIVIGPQIQRFDLIHLVGAGREHHDGGHVLLPHGADKLQTVPVRQAQIQNDQIRVVGGKQGQAHGTGVGHQRLIIIGGQQRFDKAADIRLILHNEDFEFIIAHLLHPPFQFLRSPARSGWWFPRPPGSRP